MTQITQSPILDTILDTDAYKFFMQQAVFHLYPDVNVKAEFKCRCTENLSVIAADLKQQIQFLGELSLTDDEYDYLASLPYFKKDYLDYLKAFKFNPEIVDVSIVDNQLAISIEGLWLDVILWEVPLLALVCELYQSRQHPDISKMSDIAIQHLQNKLEQVADKATRHNLSKFKVIDFGTRRRFSKQVQYDVVKYLKQHFPYFVGTSNFHLARTLDLQPMGTQAHEWFQAHQQISPKLGKFQKLALEAWLQEYPDVLGIALTDCINMDAFLTDLEKPFAQRFNGLRHDSGDPLLWGEKAIKHYESLGIDPKEKTLVFSDGLTLQKAVNIYRHFRSRTNTSFGIGTKLTCDIPGTQSLNVVLKLTECNNKPVAKISDEPGKTLSRDVGFIEKLKSAFAIA